MANKRPDHPDVHAFGRWRFNADTGDLYDGENTTRLEPKVAKLLDHFLAHQHRVVSRDELIAAVWEGRVVSDDAVNRCISILRQTLSPQDKNEFIETVVRKGYLAHFPPAAVAKRAAVPPFRRGNALILVAVAGVAAVILYWMVGNPDASLPDRDTNSDGGPPMVAVLPFTAASKGGDTEFFARGVQDDLLTQLTKLQSMRVISSTSVREYRDTPRNIRQIGKELGADAILEGGVQIANDRIHINAQLIDARTDEHLWAETYDRELLLENIFEVQSEIAHAVANAMSSTLTEQNDAQLATVPTENMAAYRAYHRAMQIRDSSQDEDPRYQQALEEAVELDPTFSRAWAELVSNLAFLNFSGDNPESTLRAERALQTLQSIAPESADYRIGQAAYIYYALKDYDRAHDIISQALTMSPSDVRAVELRSLIERRQGNFDAMVESIREARELDPRNPLWTDVLLIAVVMTRRYDEAWAVLEHSPLESFYTDYTRSLLHFREHRDFSRLQKSMEDLCQLHKEPDCEWEARIANRDYAGALASLGQTGDGFEEPGLSENDVRRIFTYWLMKDDKLLAQGMSKWQSQLETDRDDTGDFYRPESYIGSALLAGVQGNSEESEQWIHRFFRRNPIDWAVRTDFRHEACQVLGMIDATPAAVKCIRDGLHEPSFIAPFLEPYLPFYDSLRDEPEFIKLLAEIDGEAG